jgi:hypothetical protein
MLFSKRPSGIGAHCLILARQPCRMLLRCPQSSFSSLARPTSNAASHNAKCQTVLDALSKPNQILSKTNHGISSGRKEHPGSFHGYITEGLGPSISKLYLKDEIMFSLACTLHSTRTFSMHRTKRGIYTAFGNFKVSTFEATYPVRMGYVASKVVIS